MKSTRRVLGHSLLRSLVRSHRSLIPHYSLRSAALRSFVRSFAHSFTPELMGKRFLPVKQMRRFHTLSTHCASFSLNQSRDGSDRGASTSVKTTSSSNSSSTSSSQRSTPQPLPVAPNAAPASEPAPPPPKPAPTFVTSTTAPNQTVIWGWRQDLLKAGMWKRWILVSLPRFCFYQNAILN